MKSNVSDFLEIVQVIYKDACAKCIADVSDLRDLDTLRSRVKNEGLSFLTITLPSFCSDFEKSLADGYIASTSFRAFGHNKGESIPRLFRGMTKHVFDQNTGRILDGETSFTRSSESSIASIVECVRQLCLTFKKVEVSCTPERVQLALSSFVSIEQSFEAFSLPEEDLARFGHVSSVLWGNLVQPLRLSDCIPRHGPGATAERISGNAKYNWRNWHDRLEPYFPLVDNGFPIGIPLNAKELEEVTIIPEDMEQPVRVVPVPKTLKSPRIIAIEPCCMQYVQQGIRDLLYRSLDSFWLTAGHINFRDQSVNQRLAIESSKSGRLATIDLSDASDRVPRDLALEMFRSNPDLRDAIEACRSTRAMMPDGRIIGPLRKFASMGSALCFPVEAMYFYTICVMALLDAQHLPVTFRNLHKVSRDVHVYGDDIIVPRAYAIVVLDYLRKYNCKVNANKTFVSGSFRESCGVDAYAGTEVTPVYLRSPRPKNQQEASRIISWTASANLFYLKGYWHTARLMFSYIEAIVGSLPYLDENSEGLSRFSFLAPKTIGQIANGNRVRWNPKFQRLEIWALVGKPVYQHDELEGYGALTKCFLRGSKSEMAEDPIELRESSEVRMRRRLLKAISEDEDHLNRFALHGAVTLKHRWIPVK